MGLTFNMEKKRKLFTNKFKFTCPLCDERHTYNGGVVRCNGTLMQPHIILTAKIAELENILNSLLNGEKSVCIAMRDTEGETPSPSQSTEGTEWKCPHCKRPFLSGAVTMEGERYFCSHCKIWFKEEDDNFIKVKFVEIK